MQLRSWGVVSKIQHSNAVLAGTSWRPSRSCTTRRTGMKIQRWTQLTWLSRPVLWLKASARRQIYPKQSRSCCLPRKNNAKRRHTLGFSLASWWLRRRFRAELLFCLMLGQSMREASQKVWRRVWLPRFVAIVHDSQQHVVVVIDGKVLSESGSQAKWRLPPTRTPQMKRLLGARLGWRRRCGGTWWWKRWWMGGKEHCEAFAREEVQHHQACDLLQPCICGEENGTSFQGASWIDGGNVIHLCGWHTFADQGQAVRIPIPLVYSIVFLQRRCCCAV